MCLSLICFDAFIQCAVADEDSSQQSRAASEKQEPSQNPAQAEDSHLSQPSGDFDEFFASSKNAVNALHVLKNTIIYNYELQRAYLVLVYSVGESVRCLIRIFGKNMDSATDEGDSTYGDVSFSVLYEIFNLKLNVPSGTLFDANWNTQAAVDAVHRSECSETQKLIKYFILFSLGGEPSEAVIDYLKNNTTQTNMSTLKVFDWLRSHKFFGTISDSFANEKLNSMNGLCINADVVRKAGESHRVATPKKVRRPLVSATRTRPLRKISRSQRLCRDG
jgi:hypothetical protein